MTESMAELATEDMITALRAQRAHLLEKRAEMQMRVIHLENDEAVSLSFSLFILFIIFYFFKCHTLPIPLHTITCLITCLIPSTGSTHTL